MQNAKPNHAKADLILWIFTTFILFIFISVVVGLYISVKMHRQDVLNQPMFTSSSLDTEIRYLLFKGDTVEIRKITTNKYDYMNLSKAKKKELIRMLHAK